MSNADNIAVEQPKKLSILFLLCITILNCNTYVITNVK